MTNSKVHRINSHNLNCFTLSLYKILGISTVAISKKYCAARVNKLTAKPKEEIISSKAKFVATTLSDLSFLLTDLLIRTNQIL